MAWQTSTTDHFNRLVRSAGLLNHVGGVWQFEPVCSLALTRHSRPALTAELFIPSPQRMVLTDPSQPKAERTIPVDHLSKVPIRPSSLRTVAAEVPTLSIAFSRSSFDTLRARVPVFDFVWLVQIDLTTVRRHGLRKAVHVVLLKEGHGPAWGAVGGTVRSWSLSFQPSQQCKFGSEVPVSAIMPQGCSVQL